MPIHGLHFIKMFPIKKEHMRKFHTDQDTYYAIVHKVINDNLPMIVRMAQEYLSKYAAAQASSEIKKPSK